jgi:nucleoside 2-deoxyribosyltransferase
VSLHLKPTYYLAGPMRGYPEFNFPAFRSATKILREAGYGVISPHEMDEAAGYDWAGFTGKEDLSEYNFDIVLRLLEDIQQIASRACAGVICLTGWEDSSGARAEAAYAQAVGKRLYELLPYDNIFGHGILYPIKVSEVAITGIGAPVAIK